MHTPPAPPPPIEALPTAVFTFEATPPRGGALVYGAERVARLAGLPDGDLGQDLTAFLDRVHPADVAAFHDSLDAATRGHTRWSVRLRVGTRAIEWQANPVTEDGCTRWHGVACDVTERGGEHALRRLVDALPDAVWLKDRQGRYQACSLRFSRIIGRPGAEILGKTDAELGLPADDAARAEDALALGGDRATVTEEWVSFAEDGHQELLEVIRTVLRDGVGEPTGVLAVGRDVTARRALEARLRTTASVFDAAREGIAITDPDGTILEVNAAFTRVTGYPREAVLGKNPRVLSSGLQDRAFYERLWRALRTQGAWSGELVNRRPDGGLYNEHLDIVAVAEPGGRIKHFVGVFSDITAVKEHEQQLEHMAHHDALTGLPNRFLLADRLDRAIAEARRSDRMLAVLYLDLDGFKPVNDQHGHPVGDRVLVHVADRLSAAVRGGDTVARLGGDEFVCILTDLAGADECEQVARRLLGCVDQPIHLDGHLVHLSASIGISLFPNGDGEDADLLLRHADQAMYRAKAGGRNRFVFHHRDATTRGG